MSTPEQKAAGSIFTRTWAADFVLDVAGYTTNLDLNAQLAIEPACGDGAFVGAMVRRVADSARLHGKQISSGAIRAFDIDGKAVEATREVVQSTLVSSGCSQAKAAELARGWVVQGDFLAGPSVSRPRWVLGNPPYVRPERIPRETLTRYREAWPTMRGRADIYIGFFEAALKVLDDRGSVAFLCADRWMYNAYGRGLRELVDHEFNLKLALELHGVDVFERRVHAYPSLFLITREQSDETLVLRANKDFGPRGGASVVRSLTEGPTKRISATTFDGAWVPSFTKNPAEGWLNAKPAAIRRLEDIASRLPTLEESGARVFTGLATGLDRVFVTTDPELVEESRLAKLVEGADVNGHLTWGGKYLVSPWEDDGSLVTLARYPRFAAYMRRNQKALKARHVVKVSDKEWWRTIDRPDAQAYRGPKLLIPDLKERLTPALDLAGFVPKNTLHGIVPGPWDVEVLGALLLSEIANQFVLAYSVRFANGRVRFSAQYLRRIRLPHPSSVDSVAAAALRTAFRHRDRAQVEILARPLFR